MSYVEEPVYWGSRFAVVKVFCCWKKGITPNIRMFCPKKYIFMMFFPSEGSTVKQQASE